MTKTTQPSITEDPRQKVVDNEESYKRWTVAIYMVADGRSGTSDLDQVAIRELTEIVEAAGSQIENVNVAVQLDLHGIQGTLRLLVQGDNNARGVFLTERNAASADTLDEFLAWVTKRSKSEHYLLLFWGHSSGPVVFVGDFEAPKRKLQTKGTAEMPQAIASEMPKATGLGVGNLSGVMKRFGAAIRGNQGSFKEAKDSYCTAPKPTASKQYARRHRAVQGMFHEHARDGV